MTEPTTPLMQQYHAVKRQHPAALLLFRLGDFYELFYDDAKVASKILQITLTSRNKEKEGAVPMCGVPYHAAENYIARLIRAGHKVAICEQMEEPGPGKKIVRREVIRVLTPGTATGAGLIEAKENNFLAAVARSSEASAAMSAGGRTSSRAGGASATIGLAFVDLSTGEFRATEFSGERAEARLRDELGILRPREVLLPQPVSLFPSSVPAASELNGLGAVETRLDDWVFETNHATRLLEEHFRVAGLEGFGLSEHSQATAAAGALVHYLRETSAIGARKPEDAAVVPSMRPAGTGLEHLDRIAYYEQQDAMILDQVTARNLELVEASSGDDARATLLAAIDETATGMGARLLRSWVLRPEIWIGEIEARLEAVAQLKAQTVAREEIWKELEGILDLERLTSRVTLGVVTPRDLLALRGSLEKIPQVRVQIAAMTARSSRLAVLCDEMDEMADVRDLIARGISDEPPAMVNEPGVIRRGYHVELDELRDITKQGRQIIAAMEERERKRTGIASLKIRYNQVFGFYIEISKANLHLAPADYERKQTLVNAERFTSGELKEYERKVLSAEERVLEIERRLYGEIREAIAREAARLRRTAAAIAQLDVLVNFARIAASRNYSRPQFTTGAAEGEGSAKAGSRTGFAVDRGRAASSDRKAARGTRRAFRAERFVSRRRNAVSFDHHRAEYGRQVYVSAASSADFDPGADGIVRPRGRGEVAGAGSRLYPNRRLGQSRTRAFDISCGDERGGRNLEYRNVRESRTARRSGPRNINIRRTFDRLGRGGSAACRRTAEDAFRHALSRAYRARAVAAGSEKRARGRPGSRTRNRILAPRRTGQRRQKLRDRSSPPRRPSKSSNPPRPRNFEEA